MQTAFLFYITFVFSILAFYPEKKLSPFLYVDCGKYAFTSSRCAKVLRYVARRTFLSGALSRTNNIILQEFPYRRGKKVYLTQFLNLRPERNPRTARRILSEYSSLFLPYKSKKSSSYLFYGEFETEDSRAIFQKDVSTFLKRRNIHFYFEGSSQFKRMLKEKFPEKIGIVMDRKKFSFLKKTLFRKKQIYGTFSQDNCKYYAKINRVVY
ncbi:MAG: hypothetical protein D6767_02415, partial [Candidatus Hydrogenedentota bacterium]